MNPRAHSALGVAYNWADRHDEAIRAFEASLDLSPGFVAAHFSIGMARLLAGDAEGALEASSRETGDEEYQVKGTALALYTLGRTEEHEAAFSELRERWGDRWPSEVAHVYAWRGDADAAFEWLDRAIEQNEDGLHQQHLQPFYRPIHDDPRWEDFLERTGTSERDLEAVKFDFRLPG